MKPWIAMLAALIGIALSTVSPAAAVGISFLGAAAALFTTARFNVGSSQLAAAIAVLCHAGAILLASSPIFAVAALAALLPLVNYSFAVRRFGYGVIYAAWAGLGVALVLSAAGAPDGGARGLAVVPSLAFATQLAFMLRRVRQSMESRVAPEWGVKVGEQVPDFTLRDRPGQTEFTLSNERGRFVLITFLTGDWCPICHVRMRQYQRAAPQLAEHGTKLVLITASAGADSVAFAQEIGLDYLVLADEDCRVARMFRAVQKAAALKGREVPVPASFLVGPDGTLRHTSRPDVADSFLNPDDLLGSFANLLPARALT